MKKLIALTLALLMLTMSFVACTKGDGETTTEPVENNNDVTTAPEADQTTEEVTEAPVELPYKSALELLTTIHDGYNATANENTMLYVVGGNIYNFETCSQSGPAKFVANADTDYNDNLGYPAADVSKLDDAASMSHSFNANLFTCYTVHFTNSADVDGMVNAIKDNTLARQWVCGAPEKLVIVKIPGDYLLVVYGVVADGGIVDPFVASIPTLVEGATVVLEQNIAQ